MQVYVALVLLESLGIITLCIVSLVYAQSHPSEDRSVRPTSVVSILSAVALLYFSIDSILQENIMQFYASILTHGLLTSYSIWHYLQADLGETYAQVSLYVMVIVCTLQLVYMIIAVPVQDAFGWRLYKVRHRRRGGRECTGLE
jgi:hypothetical protein